MLVLALVRDLFFAEKVRQIVTAAGAACVTRHDAASLMASLSETAGRTARPPAAWETRSQGPEAGRPATSETSPSVSAVLVDLSTPGEEWEAAVAAAHSRGIPTIAFGPHVDRESHRRARAAGCRWVLSNRQVASGQLRQVLEEVLGEKPGGAIHG